MQQFTVPQFIDVENKIIGPITARQFLIVLIAAIIVAISYKIFDFSLFLTVGIFVFLIAVLFAFVKVNGRPFHFFVLNIIQTLLRPSTSVWNNRLIFLSDIDLYVFVVPVIDDSIEIDVNTDDISCDTFRSSGAG